MRETILRLVTLSTGITAQKLLMDVMAECGNTTVDHKEFFKICDELVEKEKVVRVEYVIPPEHSVKRKMATGALYLPERSVVIVNTRNDKTIFRSQR